MRGVSSWLTGTLACAALAVPAVAGADTIKILDVGDYGYTEDGTYFVGDPNPTEPSTGTGVFEPFVRIQGTGHGWCDDQLVESCDSDSTQQLGMNTDVRPNKTNYDTKGGSHWTRSITLGEVGIVEINGVTYYEFLLDANEEGRATSDANQIELTDVQIYVNSDAMFANPELSGLGIDGTGYTGTPFNSMDNSLLGYDPAWSLDSVENGDVTVLLQASICDNKGQCGSGHGDMAMYIPTELIDGDADDYLVFYTEYNRASNPNGGFEEWSTRSTQTPAVPEPSAALVFAMGMLVTGARLRRQ